LLPNHEIRLLTRELVQHQAVPLQQILLGTGVAPRQLEQPAQRLSLEQELAVYTRIAYFNRDPSLGLRVGARLNLPNYGILGCAMMAASTIGEALGLLVDFSPLVSWASHSRLSTCRFHGALCSKLTIVPTAAEPRAAALEIESTFASLQTVFNELMVEPVQFSVLEVRRPASNADQAGYRRLFNCPVRFGCKDDTLVIPKRLLLHPLPHPQPEFRELFRDMCRQTLATLTEDRGLVAAIKARLQLEVAAMPSLEQMASMLGLSSRTLRRRLRLVGTTYQSLLDEIRYREARRFLMSTRDTVESIATRLGYADARSFRTACKRWSGRTPREIRRELLA
jgi:AraC-like DNA-binding protein